MRKAYGYLRVSGKGQLDGDGFPRQKAAIKGHAEAHGIKVVKWFEERAVPGATELANRPALQELLIALHSDGVTLVLIEKLDRLARDLMVQETIVADMRKNGFELISTAEPDLCSDDPSRKLVRQVFGAISEYEKAMIVIKLKAARQRMRLRDGRCEGRKPYGDRDGEPEVVDRMRKLAKQGRNYAQIADQLNRDEVPTRANGKWFPATVSRILARSIAGCAR
jgi:DNA invertase Pin-like site-specific DNA recombinase